MATKQRVSLRRKQAVKKEDETGEKDSDAFDMKSPIRETSEDAGPSNALLSPRFGHRSPIPSTSKSKHSPHSNEACLDDSWGSGLPSPSKWECLLPDFNSQPEGVVAEVLWDCSSPDAARHLRRVGKDNSNIKQLVALFKEPSGDKQNMSPPFQMHVLRAAFKKQLQKKAKPRNKEKKKQKKLAKQREQKKAHKEREKELLQQLELAVKKREELEAEEREGKESDTVASAATTKTEDTKEGDDNDDDDDGGGGDDDVDDDDWEDDDLFENNSFIIAATQNPHLFLGEYSAKTSTPKHVEKTEASLLKQCDNEFCAKGNSSDTDSQNSEVIPPTYISPRLRKAIDVRPRILFGASADSAEQESEEDEAVVNKQKTFAPPKSRTDQCQVKQSCDLASSVPSTSLAGNTDRGWPDLLSSSETQRRAQGICLKSGVNTGQFKAAHQNDHKAKTSASITNPQSKICPSHYSDDMSDDEVSDEVLLKVTEHYDKFNSQLIQEFPTQAAAKWSASAAPISVKHVNAHPDDFVDDLDFKFLAEIYEYDSSFSDSPVRRKKTNNQLTESERQGGDCEDTKPEHSESKQLKLEENVKATSSAITCINNNNNIINYGKMCGQNGSLAASTKAGGVLNSAVQNSKNANPKVNFSNVQNNRNQPAVSSFSVAQSLKPQNIKPTKNSDLIFPPFVENKQDRTKPLSSLAMGNTVSKNSYTTGKKFTFKPLSSASTSSAVHTPLSTCATASVTNKGLSSNTAVKATQASKFGTAAVSRTSVPSTSAFNNSRASRSGVSVLKSSSASALNTSQASKVGSAAVTKLSSSTTALNANAACSQHQLDTTDNFMDDDPVYESQIMAILDQVESQASQQMGTQVSSSPGTASTQPKCSQEEIEKKRQAALQKRRRDEIEKKRQAALQKRRQEEIEEKQQAALQKRWRDDREEKQQAALQKRRQEEIEEKRQVALQKRWRDDREEKQQAALQKRRQEEIEEKRQAALQKRRQKIEKKQQAALQKRRQEEIEEKRQVALQKRWRDDREEKQQAALQKRRQEEIEEKRQAALQKRRQKIEKKQQAALQKRRQEEIEEKRQVALQKRRQSKSRLP